MPAGIVIVGLGPGAPDQITMEAWGVLEGAREVHLRTNRHPSVGSLPRGPVYHSFDAFYEERDTFDEVYDEIARRVVGLGERSDGVIYAVPGHPLVGETSVLRTMALAEREAVPVRIVAGISFIEPMLTALGIDAVEGLQICDATILAAQHHPNLDPDVGALIVQVYSRMVAAEAKMTLMNLYHDDHPIRIVRHAGMADQSVHEMPLYQLDRQEAFDHLTTVYVPPLECRGSLASYQDVVARLRAPGGCPWDREQTHQSLRSHLLEETYEVLAAIDADEMPLLEEELGDLLLQVLLHAQIAVEDGSFKLVDSVNHAIEKLVRRHPHVFGSAQVGGADDVLRSWEQIKRAEKGEEETDTSMLAGINRALPALSQAMEMQRRVARVGFDWPDAEGVAAKLCEEIDEFRSAADDEARAAEMGDLLFSLVNLARWYEIDPESILREANQRFAARFGEVERLASEQAKPLEDMSLQEMDALWEQAKFAPETG